MSTPLSIRGRKEARHLVAAEVLSLASGDYRYVVDPETGCWLWAGATDRGGYGRIWFGGKLWAAHRVFYEIHREPIPPKMQIDHLCCVRLCVRPDHLEPVWLPENIARGARTRIPLKTVRAIRRAKRDEGLGVPALAERFALPKAVIYEIAEYHPVRLDLKKGEK